MRYAVGMTPGFRLNTATAHTWAAVVSGTAWKRHTLESDGALAAEYAYGPLIIWAKNTAAKDLIFCRRNSAAIQENHKIQHIERTMAFPYMPIFMGKRLCKRCYAELIDIIDAFRENLSKGHLLNRKACESIKSEAFYFGRYFASLSDKSVIRNFLKSFQILRLNLVKLLRHIKAAAYRAHLARRVKPAPRRHRIRRPLYARPRPPSAPLAPPVI